MAPVAPPIPNKLGACGPAVRRLNDDFEVVGLPVTSPTFPSRRQAERWLEAEIAKLPIRLQPKERLCLCCRTAFRSDGPHHRLCGTCRLRDAGPVAAAWARPGRRGQGARA